MFKRRFPWFGILVSDEGFQVSFAHKGVYYSDERGRFEFGYEDGLMSATPYQIEGKPISLSQSEIEQMVDRVVRGIEWDGGQVEVFPKS